MIQNKKAFTLVELIVVISILAILGSIGFLSMQSYALDSRNTKRVYDVGSLCNSIENKLALGVSTTGLISNSSNTLANPIISGDTVLTGPYYNAGEVNYNVLEIKRGDFIDPTEEYYRIGATSKLGNKYEVATTLESPNGEKLAHSKGSYTPRKSINTISMIESGLGTAAILLTKNSDLRVGDTIQAHQANGTPTQTGTIVDVRGNLLLLKSPLFNISTSYVQLLQDETPGLIAVKNDNTQAVIKDTQYIPY